MKHRNTYNMQISYSELFKVQNGKIVPKVKIKIGQTIFKPNLAFYEIDFSSFWGKKLDVLMDDDIYLIKGEYPN